MTCTATSDLRTRLLRCRTKAERAALREELIASCMALVHHLAGKFKAKNSRLNYPDLASAGHIGLVYAANTYDPRRAGFATHAHWWIMNYLTKEAKAQRSLVAVPDNLHSAFAKHERGEPVAVDRERLEAVGRAWAPMHSLDRPFPDGGLGHFAAPEPDERPYEPEEWDRVKDAMRFLPPLDRKVIELRYLEGLTLSQIGERLNVSKERVRQRQLKGLTKLKGLVGA